MPPDIAMLTARVKGTVRVLGEFSQLREAEYSRSDYMQVRVRVRVGVGVRVSVSVRGVGLGLRG